MWTAQTQQNLKLFSDDQLPHANTQKKHAPGVLNMCCIHIHNLIILIIIESDKYIIITYTYVWVYVYMCVGCSHCENKKLCPGRVSRETHKQLEANTNGTGAGWQILAVKKTLTNPRARIQLRNNTYGTRAGWPAWAVKRSVSNLRDTQSIGNQHEQHLSGVTKVGCDESLSATRGTHKLVETNTNGT